MARDVIAIVFIIHYLTNKMCFLVDSYKHNSGRIHGWSLDKSHCWVLYELRCFLCCIGVTSMLVARNPFMYTKEWRSILHSKVISAKIHFLWTLQKKSSMQEVENKVPWSFFLQLCWAPIGVIRWGFSFINTMIICQISLGYSSHFRVLVEESIFQRNYTDFIIVTVCITMVFEECVVRVPRG